MGLLIVLLLFDFILLFIVIVYSLILNTFNTNMYYVLSGQYFYTLSFIKPKQSF